MAVKQACVCVLSYFPTCWCCVEALDAAGDGDGTCGDGWGRRQDLWGGMAIGMISISVQVSIAKCEGAVICHEECRRGAHLPVLGCEPVGR